MNKSLVFAAALALSFLGTRLGESAVKLVRVPNNGIQPQTATDPRGVVHLVYFSGEASHGDLFYVHSADGGATFSAPIRVNSQEGSAIASGNIRGARIALGVNGTIHVAWNGSSNAKAPMLYTRLNAAGRSFEPQRNLIHSAYGIDGGGAIAADQSGNVYVFWHAPLLGKNDENDRRVWLAQSKDNGSTFDPERVAFTQPTGVCGCCGMNAFADPRGNIYALFRSASEMVHRDMYLLHSGDHGRTFTGADISKWNVGYCVMSTAAFAQSDGATLAAWETEKQVFYSSIDSISGLMKQPIPAPGMGSNRKHPALASNRRGETLLAWTEGMGWKKGGSLSWQVFDPSGHPLGQPGTADGVPVWDLLAAFTAPDGTFRILY